VKHDVQAVIYVRGEGGPRFLLIERYDPPSGQFHWRLVKGTVRPGEGAEEALLREIREEVGLERARVVAEVGSYSFTEPTSGVRHQVRSFLVEADPAEPVKLAPSDDGRRLRGYRWAGPGEALRLLRWPEEKAILRRAFEILAPGHRPEGV